MSFRFVLLASLTSVIFFLQSTCLRETIPLLPDVPVPGDSIPDFVNTSYIELDSVRQISRFRSGVGHDYSDDFEYCRSMKHYMEVPQGTPLYAPVNGIVTFLLSEWAGYKMQITSTAKPDYFFEIFHITLAHPFSVGDTVTEGDLLGTHAFSGTYSDIVVGIRTQQDGSKDNNGPPGMGVRYVSWFEVITGSLFETYRMRGIRNRNMFIITKAQRDADSLDCNISWNGANGAGNTNNWIILN